MNVLSIDFDVFYNLGLSYHDALFYKDGLYSRYCNSGAQLRRLNLFKNHFI